MGFNGTDLSSLRSELGSIPNRHLGAQLNQSVIVGTVSEQFATGLIGFQGK